MTLVLILAGITGVVGFGWLVVVLLRVYAPPAQQPPTPARRKAPPSHTSPNPAKRTPPKRTIPDSEKVLDLRGVESTRMRVKGTSYYIPDSGRRYAGSREYWLIREPDNPHDELAIAVVASDGRKVGYVSANRAALMSPILDQLPAEAYLVAGTSASEHSTALRVDLPRLPALRTFVKQRRTGA